MRAYNVLLRLYPASFRNEYGGEMRPLFERRRAQARGVGIVTLWVGTIGEVVANAVADLFGLKSSRPKGRVKMPWDEGVVE